MLNTTNHMVASSASHQPKNQHGIKAFLEPTKQQSNRAQCHTIAQPNQVANVSQALTGWFAELLAELLVEDGWWWVMMVNDGY